jgi:uncharacterized protein (DUF2141 family)
MIKRKIAALALIAALPMISGAGEPASLTITVSGIRNTTGGLIACVFRDRQGFPTCQKSRTAIIQRSRITGATMTVRFSNLAPGSYVASVQHDEDGDGKLKTNFIGIPKEGVGISNNPGGIPSWGRSLFRMSGDAGIGITMRYI